MKMEITIGNLIDKLTIINIRIWKAEDIKRSQASTDKMVADAARITNKANQERNDIIEAIDKYFGKDTGQGSMKIHQ